MTTGTNTLSSLSDQLADAVARVRQSLVTVNGRPRQAASGVAIGNDLILTADHVVEREDELTVQTDDGRTVSAQFVGRDPATDLAVLRAPGLNVPAIERASEARVGALVLAVGRPSPAGPMASLGVVSAVGGPLRTQRGGTVEQVIQTDATPYPGFSGGPLIDTNGAAYGILTTGLIGGVALAIPSAIAWNVAETLAAHGQIKRGFLGISSQPVSLPEGQRAGRSQENGLLIVKVENGSPAAQGGLLLGDIMVGMAGQPVTDTEQLQALLTGERVGTPVPVEIIRGGALQTLMITVGQRS